MFNLTPPEQKFVLLGDVRDVNELGRTQNTEAIHFHHTAGHPMATAEQIDKLHKKRTYKDSQGNIKNWSGIGYHFVILENGLIQLGRNFNKTPASIGGHNSHAIAMVMTGNFSEKPMPTRLDPQARAAGLLAAFLIIEFDAPFLFHSDLASTECPGLNMDHEVVMKYIDHVMSNLTDWGRWYADHVIAFNSLHPGFRYTSNPELKPVWV